MVAEAPVITCAQCGVSEIRRGPGQKYCAPCSEVRDLARKSKWAREHPQKKDPAAAVARKSEVKRRGDERNAALTERFGISNTPELVWFARIAVPFSYAASKNHIYSIRSAGHVFLRKEGKAMRSAITLAIKSAVRDAPIRQHKVWLDIYVEKPDHRGDAVNVVDLVCDAVKDAIGIDDRWFCIRKLDWQIKRNGMLYVGLGQEEVEDSRVCSACGLIQPFSMFNKNKHGIDGIGRECVECRRKRPAA